MQSKWTNAVATESFNPRSPRPGFEAAMFIETSHVLRHTIFTSSPIITRLLIWLMQETLDGRGDMVKSYTIAVDGLGRPDDFDTYSDSYPRVQTGRLRKALENYYARHAPLDDLCVYLQQGSYRLRLAKVELAYPQLYRPLLNEQLPVQAEDFSPTHVKESAGTLRRTNMTEVPTFVLMIILVSLLFLAAMAMISAMQVAV